MFQPLAVKRINSCLYWAVQWSCFARVNALCNLSRKKWWMVAASLPGWFLCRRCCTLCITVEIEPRTTKQYKCHHCWSCKNYWWKGMECRKKVSALFFGWPADCEFGEKMPFGAGCHKHKHPQDSTSKLLLVARHILTMGLQKCL